MTGLRFETRPTQRDRIVIWLVGTVIASLIPFLAVLFHGIDRRQIPSLTDVLGRGDLLVISVVVTIGGASEILPVIRRVAPEKFRLLSLAYLGCFLSIVAEAIWYADVTATILDGGSPSANLVTGGSLLFFALSAACSSVCVAIAAGAE